MSAIDQLMGALRSAEGMLAALGPEPKGDVPGMKALARAIRAEAEAASAGAQAAATLPRSLTFRGPAADQLAMNGALVGGTVRAAVAQLEAAAERVDHEAAKIDRQQREWRADRGRLQSRISQLAAQIRSASP